MENNNASLAALIELFERDLKLLAKEVKAYPTEESLWIVPEGISNSGGNLCLHLIGNLNHFISHTLGGFDYQRKRDLEFSAKNVPLVKMIADIEQCKSWLRTSLEKLSEEKLEENFPIRVFDREHTNLHFIMHLAGHLNYHLGQINYHRRLLVI